MFNLDHDQRAFGWYADFDGCGYYRIIKPMEALKESIILPDIWKTSYDRTIPHDWRDFDVIVGQRICQSDGSGGGSADLWVEKITKDRNVLSVFEVDDDLFNVDPSNPAHDFYAQEGVRQNLKSCIATADAVTVSTEPLRQEMLKWNPNVRVVPNFIDSRVLDIPRKEPGETVVIGWSGSATHQMDFAPMTEELGILMGMMPHTRFMTIGGNYSHGLPINRVQALGWISTPRKVFKQAAKFDIGIAPLLPHKFNDSKSYIKALEYAALGIPCVASATGPYLEFVDHGVTGFLVERPGQWKEYVGLLVRDVELRRTMGLAARRKAERYTIQGNAWRWANALRG